MNRKEIEINEDFLMALEAVNKGLNLFITGKAGTGKSTFLTYLRSISDREVVVLAPTGVAALNVGGQTIHSFFGFKPDVTPHKVLEFLPKDKEVYRNLEALVIDEVSMVRADLLDSVETFLRLHGPRPGEPFGGVQVVLIGDLYQLPPVVTRRDKVAIEIYKSPYFFDSEAFKRTPFELIEFEKVYRHSDPLFLEVLEAIRTDTVTEEHLRVLNSRYISDFEPPEGEFYVYLTTTNDLAKRINEERLSRLPGSPVRYRGRIEGEFDLRDLPTSIELSLKHEAQVMLLNNDPEGRWANGYIGRVVEVEARKGEPDVIWVELENGTVVDVLPYKWEMFEFYFDPKEGKLKSRTIGAFVQYPLKLSWAVTIHKAQGLTFDKVVLDVGRGTFSHGQLYVAISRCRSLDNLVLKRPIERRHVLLDRRIVRFLTRLKYRQAESRNPLKESLELIRQAIKEQRKLEITYLKASDRKSKRVILPMALETMEHEGKAFLGLKAFCTLRGTERVFNVSKILDLKLL